MEWLRQAQIIDPIHLLTIKSHLLGMMEADGSCERMRNTPIPFSYSFFIGIMPIVLVDTCGY